MSLELALQIDTGGLEPAIIWDDWDCTSNLNPMFRLFLGMNLGDYLAGKTAGEALPTSRLLVADMEARPEVYRALNPENGWGSYDTLLPALRDLIGAAQDHPNASWRVWQ